LRSLFGAVFFLILAASTAQPSLALNPTPGGDTQCLESAEASVLTLPPPVLPAALAVRYPNGAMIRNTVDVDASGRVLRVRSSAESGDSTEKSVTRDLAGPLGKFVIAWASAGTFRPPVDQCKSQAGSIILDTVFLPAASGITATPPIVAGVNFYEMTYKPGPCAKSDIPDPSRPVPMHLGEYTFSASSPTQDPRDIHTTVDEVFAGTVGSVPAAVVTLGCEVAAGSYTSDARVYRIAAGAATSLGSIGVVDHLGGDSPMVEGDWIHVSFSGGLLYVDAWSNDARCKANDWTASTYSIRNDKLVLLNKQFHHRVSTPRACDYKPLSGG
jgi:hypothetical protein